jgi:hypothetical protein
MTMENTTDTKPAEIPPLPAPTGSESMIDRMLESHPLIGARERHNIRRALDAARAYGYGNVMAWLATEWAVKLRDEQGLSEETAILAVSNRSPYALPPNEKGQRCAGK